MKTFFMQQGLIPQIADFGITGDSGTEEYKVARWLLGAKMTLYVAWLGELTTPVRCG